MANTTKPLTNTEVKQAKPKAKEYNLADGNGLYARVKPNGTKLWVFNYSRPFTKIRANISLGIYPNVSLSEARVKRQEYNTLLSKDIDPKEHRFEQKNLLSQAHINTLNHVTEKWLVLKKSPLVQVTIRRLLADLTSTSCPR